MNFTYKPIKVKRKWVQMGDGVSRVWGHNSSSFSFHHRLPPPPSTPPSRIAQSHLFALQPNLYSLWSIVQWKKDVFVAFWFQFMFQFVEIKIYTAYIRTLFGDRFCSLGWVGLSRAAVDCLLASAVNILKITSIIIIMPFDCVQFFSSFTLTTRYFSENIGSSC